MAAVAADGLVVARGDGIALAAVCRAGQYALIFTSVPRVRPWTGSLRALAVTDSLLVDLTGGVDPAPSEVVWYRVAGAAGTWMIPNGRSYTRRLLVLSARHGLGLRVWLPEDDRAARGRSIPASQEAVARMWLYALQC